MNDRSIRKFGMKRDALSYVITTLWGLMVIGVVCYFVYTSSGTYLPAWISILLGAIIVLVYLSAPRSVIVTRDNIEIHCVADLTVIPRSEIKKIEPLSVKSLRGCVPLYAVWGVFGYYGYYLNLRNFRVFRMYASQRRNLVVIKYGEENKRVVVSVRRREEFLEFLS